MIKLKLIYINKVKINHVRGKRRDEIESKKISPTLVQIYIYIQFPLFEQLSVNYSGRSITKIARLNQPSPLTGTSSLSFLSSIQAQSSTWDELPISQTADDFPLLPTSGKLRRARASQRHVLEVKSCVGGPYLSLVYIPLKFVFIPKVLSHL